MMDYDADDQIYFRTEEGRLGMSSKKLPSRKDRTEGARIQVFIRRNGR